MIFLGSLEVGQEVGVQHRAARRKLRLVHQLGSGAEVVIHDLSTTGLLIETSAELFGGEPIEVDLAEAGSRQATIVWNSGRFFGCQFIEAIPGAAVSSALLRSSCILPPREAQQGSRNVEQRADEEKLPLATRLRLVVALALATWLLAGLALWIS